MTTFVEVLQRLPEILALLESDVFHLLALVLVVLLAIKMIRAHL